MAIDARDRAPAISNAFTRLHREQVGRGPQLVRTVVGHDHVICFLEDFYTPLERTMIEAGNREMVRRSRHIFQETMRDRFVAIVEDLTGRTVRQFMSQVSFDPDISVEVFVLEPDRDDPAPEGVA